MHILHIASEIAPVAKVGGLGDVVLGLCRELSWKGHHIKIFLPKYDCLQEAHICDMQILEPRLEVPFSGHFQHARIFCGTVEGFSIYFIDPIESNYFRRGNFYAESDDSWRFTFFTAAALAFIAKDKIPVDIVHFHDWQTAIAPALLQNRYATIEPYPTILTIHNIEYQGWCPPEQIAAWDLQRFAIGFSAPEPHQGYNLLKGGITYADFVTTVSPSYAREVLHSDLGRSMQKTLQEKKERFCGILNGLDYSYWNPEIDRYLPRHYSSQSARKAREAKKEIKRLLQNKLDLGASDAPLVCMISRLVEQKGPALMRHAAHYTLENGGQVVLLGSSPIAELQEEFALLKKNLSHNRNIHFELQYNEELSHLLYAAADILVVPSLFEPCGLTQLIALKYGTVPVVRRTGGLQDTIFDIDDETAAPNLRNGFCFNDADETGLEWGLGRALRAYQNKEFDWDQLMLQGMKQDFSWSAPASHYERLYAALKR